MPVASSESLQCPCCHKTTHGIPMDCDDCQCDSSLRRTGHLGWPPFGCTRAEAASAQPWHDKLRDTWGCSPSCWCSLEHRLRVHSTSSMRAGLPSVTSTPGNRVVRCRDVLPDASSEHKPLPECRDGSQPYQSKGADFFREIRIFLSMVPIVILIKLVWGWVWRDF